MTSRNYDRMTANAALNQTTERSPHEPAIREMCDTAGASFKALRRAHTVSGNKLDSYDLFIIRQGDVKDQKRAIRAAAAEAGIALRTIEAH